MRHLLLLLTLVVGLLPGPVAAQPVAPLPDPGPIELACPSPLPDGTVPPCPAALVADDGGCTAPGSIGEPASPSDCPSVIGGETPDSCSISSDGSTDCPERSPAPLPPGERYTIDGIVLADGSRVEIETGEIALLDDGTFGAWAGCNRIGGHYRRDGERLVLDALVMTEMACPGAMLAEAALITVLEGERLRLVTDNGGTRLESDAGQLSLRATVATPTAGETATGGSLAPLLLIPLLAGIVVLLITGTSRPTSRRKRS